MHSFRRAPILRGGCLTLLCVWRQERGTMAGTTHIARLVGAIFSWAARIAAAGSACSSSWAACVAALPGKLVSPSLHAHLSPSLISSGAPTSWQPRTRLCSRCVLSGFGHRSASINSSGTTGLVGAAARSEELISHFSLLFWRHGPWHVNALRAGPPDGRPAAVIIVPNTLLLSV